MYYQPTIPLKFGENEGAYKSITEISQTVKQNVLFLLKTSPGEWPMKPELGVGLRRFLFENYGSSDLMALNGRIQKQFKKYMPFLEVRSQLITEDSLGNNLLDENYVKLLFEYRIKSLEIQEILLLKVTEEAVSLTE